MATRQSASQQQLRVFDFFREHKSTILSARSTIKQILLRLKARGVAYFSPPEELFRQNKKIVTFTTTVRFQGCVSEKKFVFFFRLAEKLSIEEVKTNADSFLINIYARSDFESILQKLSEKITALEKGELREQSFLNNFLIPLRMYCSDCISYVYHSSEYGDKKKGVDFIVGYIHNGEIYKVEFQLKSSNVFIEKHSTRYPRVHLFVFQEWMLEDKARLKSIFIPFLLACVRAEKGTAVHWRYPR